MVDFLQAALYFAAIVMLVYAYTQVEEIVPPRAGRFLAGGFILFAVAGLLPIIS